MLLLIIFYKVIPPNKILCASSGFFVAFCLKIASIPIDKLIQFPGRMPEEFFTNPFFHFFLEVLYGREHFTVSARLGGQAEAVLRAIAHDKLEGIGDIPDTDSVTRSVSAWSAEGSGQRIKMMGLWFLFPFGFRKRMDDLVVSLPSALSSVQKSVLFWEMLMIYQAVVISPPPTSLVQKVMDRLRDADRSFESCTASQFATTFVTRFITSVLFCWSIKVVVCWSGETFFKRPKKLGGTEGSVCHGSRESVEVRACRWSSCWYVVSDCRWVMVCG